MCQKIRPRQNFEPEADRASVCRSVERCRRRSPRVWISLLMLAILVVAPSGFAQPFDRGSEPEEAQELIVLLAPTADAPTPAEAVRAIERGRGADPSFYAGNPLSARPALSARAWGEALSRLEAAPDSPRARLERYIVLSYPPGTDLAAVTEALRRNPQVMHVEKNRRFSLAAVTPNDILLPEQYGPSLLNLPEAWERTKGHAFVGMIDVGLQVNHPDLRAHPVHIERTITGDDGLPKEVCAYMDGTYEGGNFRPQLSFDAFEGDCNVDAADPPKANMAYGHGTHVAGIVGATTDNTDGVAGACWNCALMMTKGGQSSIDWDNGAESLTFLVDHGVQIVSMSWGADDVTCATSGLDMLCQALQYADDRDVVLTASAGNDRVDIRFPASDPRVMSIGGVEADGDFWDEEDEPGGCPPFSGQRECGSNYTVTPDSAPQDLVAPAQAVLSSMYEGFDWNTVVECGDSFHPAFGYGPCTGTSMASPYAAAVAGLVRSTNPLLDKAQVRDALVKNASLGHLQDPDDQFGFGIPDGAASVDAVLGTVSGAVIANRLTPLFSLYSGLNEAETHFFTTVPQMASAALFDEVVFGTYSQSPVLPPLTPDYAQFPDATCQFGPCEVDPRASVYVFTTDREPSPATPPLVPLYRMSYDEPWNGNNKNRSFSYTTETAGIQNLKDDGYELDGVEGYIYQRCTPEPSCIPAGAVRLFRLYHPTLDDYALFPEDEETIFRNAGYISQSTLNDWIGYVYPNADADGDDLIDGFEQLIGTNPQVFDSDGDGLSDGEEILLYPYTDPLDGPTCDSVFADSFDSGDTSAWAQVVTAGSGQVGVDASSAIVGPFGMFAKIGATNDKAWVRDNSPASETFYRVSYHFQFADAKFADGNHHNVLVVRDDNPSAWVIVVAMRRSGSNYQLRARTRLDSGAVANTPWVTFSTTSQRPGPHRVELVWEAADPGQSNGKLSFSIDGMLPQLLSGLDNDSRQIDHVRFGMVGGIDAGTEGLWVFDEFESCRD